jgi:subfamily B ATP-binding cassette protein MsbA
VTVADGTRPAKGRAIFQRNTLPVLARLWREHVRAHRGTIIIVLIFIAVAAAANALYPLLVREAFNLLERRDFATLAFAPIVVILVTSTKGLALFVQSLLTNRFVTSVEADMQAALYNHLIEADIARLSRENSASLTQRFTTDFAFIKEALTRVFTVFFRDMAMLIALVAVLIYIDPWSTLVAALIAPFAIPPIARIGRKLRRVAVATQEEIGAMAAGISESLAAARVAKTFRMEPYLKARARSAFDEIRALKMKAANARARMDPILEIAAGLAIAAVIVFVGWRIQSGVTTLGDFAAYSGALIMAAQPIRTLGNLNAIVQEAMAALGRYHAVLDEPSLISERPDARPLRDPAGAVAFENVSFAYAGEAPAAVNGVTFHTRPGGVTALVGRSGSGKSTLLALVPRLFDVTGGRVTIGGEDVRDVTLASLRDAIAVVSQDVVLFDDTIAANIAFGRPGADEAAIERAARAAAAHDFIMAQPAGYATRVGERGGRLSGGERQRIALARAFLKDAPILLLDEATSALDAESETAVQAALGALQKGRTTIVIAHRLSTIREAEQIVALDQGQVVEIGDHDTLMRRDGLYATLHRMQFREGT